MLNITKLRKEKKYIVFHRNNGIHNNNKKEEVIQKLDFFFRGIFKKTTIFERTITCYY